MTKPDADTAKPFKWPTLGSCVKSWDVKCGRCGSGFPPETWILARMSPTVFCISCDCSPREWITMEVQP